ncbi:S-phase kinase-associated protein 1-like [Drosophila rhopaloa]|uniref:S-phase kinase-associated protein 1 n=1 Tax=Drosophila rhopaloa TaxID=1041015 RepID=A0ABM5J3Q7_DRORH|nr:S-phase kinase-associated protein 1-like [Drosophila rhopaloa]
MPSIKLQTSDEKIFDIDIEVAKRFGLIQTMLNCCDEKSDENDIVQLPNVKSTTFEKVLSWAKQHKDDLKTTEDDECNEDSTKEISSWDAKFLEVDNGTLFEIILAANYLEIPELLQLTCKAVANSIKGKSPDDIRKFFNIKQGSSIATHNMPDAEEKQGLI